VRHYRPLKPEEAQALEAIDQATDPMREALQREIYELEHRRAPLYRLALERIFFRQLLQAVRAMPYRPRALQKVLDRIPHASSRLEWEKLAPEARHDQMVEALPGEIPPST